MVTETEQTKPISKNYVFPDLMASMMKNIDQRTQYESTMMSIILILLGLIGFTVYYDFFTHTSIWLKLFATFNTLCGFTFLSSSLVTTYQQYVSYLESQEAISEFLKPEFLNQLNPNPNISNIETTKKEVKK